MFSGHFRNVLKEIVWKHVASPLRRLNTQNVGNRGHKVGYWSKKSCSDKKIGGFFKPILKKLMMEKVMENQSPCPPGPPLYRNRGPPPPPPCCGCWYACIWGRVSQGQNPRSLSLLRSIWIKFEVNPSSEIHPKCLSRLGQNYTKMKFCSCGVTDNYK